MKTGDAVKAEIVNVKDFGAFAEFDGGSGLIYFTQIVPRVEYGAIGKVLHVGDTVNCVISEIKSDGKISLTMKLKRKEVRKAKIEEVKQDIQNMSEEDTNIRSIWMALTDIQHFMLKYMQMPIPIKHGSTKIDSKGEKLTAEIDQEVHFNAFQNEVRRVFSADVFKHEILSGFWYFETDAELYNPEVRQLFADECSNMYVRMQANPVIEISISHVDDKSKSILLSRLQNYYAQIDVLSDKEDSLFLTLPYHTHTEQNDYRDELEYALDGISNGVPDIGDNEECIEYEPAYFNWQIKEIREGCDRFLLTLNEEALLDREGLRFGSLRGQSFVIHNGDNDIPFGKLSKIDYPKVVFSLFQDAIGIVRQLVEKDGMRIIAPDAGDLTGEIEKVNRLRDSFDRITEHPELLANPKLASYLFDASNATPLEKEIVEARIEKIKSTQLNANLNSSQISAIAKAVEAKDLALIQGPPGTGKSTAIAELIWQLALQNPKAKILLTSEANLAVDNALDKLKSSIHNIVKPIRIAAGDKFSAEGLSYAQTELKKWAGIELSKIEIEDDKLAKETDEYKSFDIKEIVLNRWLRNIYSRSHDRIENPELRKLWYDILTDLPLSWKKRVYEEYISHCNVIGATCSAISDTNYSATEEKGRHRASRFIKKFRSIYGETDKEGYVTKLCFKTVIQDEASKATPAELSLPLAYGEKAVIIGDHRQLPPNLDKEDILFKLHMQRIKSSNREEHDQILKLEKYVRKNFDLLEKSHFERLFRQIDASLKGTFDTQYRMHKDINDVIEQFYVEDNGLRCGVKDDERQHNIDIPELLSPENHVIWIDTNSPEVRDGTSRANKGEVEAIGWVLEKFAESDSFKQYLQSLSTDEEREIGLITFYGSQMKRLRPLVEQSTKKGLRIKMSSVDRFQGMERNIIIVSLVRSNSIAQKWNQRPDFRLFPDIGFPKQNDYGFAKSPNRLNVALSRAKCLLIVVGNSVHFCNYINSEGQAIYRNVFEKIKNNPKGRVIDWKTTSPVKDHTFKIIRVPMPRNRSINLNTRDINKDTDKNLRITETWLTRDCQPVQNPHFAVLELSTKAVKLLIGQDETTIMTSTEFSFKNFIRDAAKTETGRGLDEQNIMNMDFFRGRVLPVIRRMKSKMRKEEVDVVYSVATAAYRTAKNRDEIIECIRKEAGINVRILSKKEESVATMFAYGISSRYKADILKSRHTVMVDQGGGSTEVSVFNQGELEGSYSINLGTTALRNILTKEVSPNTSMRDALRKSDQMLRERMVAFMKNMGITMLSDEETFCVSVGTAITSATGKSGNAKQHDSVLEYDKISQKVENLTSTILERFDTVDDLVRWEQRIGDDTIDRILTMRMGLPMYLLLMDKFNIKSIHVCGTGLWYGIYLQHLFNVAD